MVQRGGGIHINRSVGGIMPPNINRVRANTVDSWILDQANGKGEWQYFGSYLSTSREWGHLAKWVPQGTEVRVAVAQPHYSQWLQDKAKGGKWT